MPAKKYDWEALEIEFLKSEHLDVTDFFESKFGENWVRSGGMSKRTVGWRKKKETMKEIAKTEAQKSLQKEMEEIYKPSQKELNLMHKSLMSIFQAKIYSNAQKIVKLEDGTIIIPPDVNISESERLWNIVKAEKGEVTRVTEDRMAGPDGDPMSMIQFYLPQNGREGLE